MNNITPRRRLQIFATGLLPLLVLCAILAMASQFGFDIVSVFTHAEKRDASNYVMVTKVLGVPVRSRPATEADLAQEDAAIRTVKTVVLIGSVVIVSIGVNVFCVRDWQTKVGVGMVRSKTRIRAMVLAAAECLKNQR